MCTTSPIHNTNNGSIMDFCLENKNNPNSGSIYPTTNKTSPNSESSGTNHHHHHHPLLFHHQTHSGGLGGGGGGNKFPVNIDPLIMSQQSTVPLALATNSSGQPDAVINDQNNICETNFYARSFPSNLLQTTTKSNGTEAAFHNKAETPKVKAKTLKVSTKSNDDHQSSAISKVGKTGGEQVEKPINPTSYKYLSWREKDRRRRFREEWKNLWLVIPHGKYEVMCLVCHKVMTQRKLDTIKRHTIRRHVELLSMNDSDRQVLFNLLLSVHNQQQLENGSNPETGLDGNGNKLENGLSLTQTSLEEQRGVTTTQPPQQQESESPAKIGRGRGSSAKNLSPIASVQLKRMYTQQFSQAKNHSLVKKMKMDQSAGEKVKTTVATKEFDYPLTSDANAPFNFHDIFDQLRANLPKPPELNDHQRQQQMMKRMELLPTFGSEGIFEKLKMNIFNNDFLFKQNLPTQRMTDSVQNSLPLPSLNKTISPNFDPGRSMNPNLFSLIGNNNVSSSLLPNCFNNDPNQVNIAALFSALTKVPPCGMHLPTMHSQKDHQTLCNSDRGENDEPKNFKATHPFSVLSLAMNDSQKNINKQTNDTCIDMKKNFKMEDDNQRLVNLPENALVSLTSNNSNLQVHILNFTSGIDIIPSVELYLQQNTFVKAVILNCQGFVSSVKLKQIEDNLDQGEDVHMTGDHRVISLSGMINADGVRDENLFLVLCNPRGELEGGRLSGQMVTKDEFKIVLLVMNHSGVGNGSGSVGGPGGASGLSNNSACKTLNSVDNDGQIGSSSKEKTLSDDSSSCYSAKTPDSSESPLNMNRNNKSTSSGNAIDILSHQ